MFPESTRFLIIDDYPSMRKIIKNILGELGYSQVDEAEDGAAAIQLLEQAQSSGKPYGLIISAWNKTEMPGIELLKLCKSNRRSRLIPYLLVAAENERKEMLLAAKAGASDFVIKPFTSATLKSKLEKIYLRMQTNLNKAA